MVIRNDHCCNMEIQRQSVNLSTPRSRSIPNHRPRTEFATDFDANLNAATPPRNVDLHDRRRAPRSSSELVVKDSLPTKRRIVSFLSLLIAVGVAFTLFPASKDYQQGETETVSDFVRETRLFANATMLEGKYVTGEGNKLDPMAPEFNEEDFRTVDAFVAENELELQEDSEPIETTPDFHLAGASPPQDLSHDFLDEDVAVDMDWSGINPEEDKWDLASIDSVYAALNELSSYTPEFPQSGQNEALAFRSGFVPGKTRRFGETAHEAFEDAEEFALLPDNPTPEEAVKLRNARFTASLKEAARLGAKRASSTEKLTQVGFLQDHTDATPRVRVY